jgi:dTDP-L-rhamnose 4-epimerase
MCFVEDVARANLLAATTDALDGRAVNVGSGRPTTVREMAGLVGEALGVQIEPLARGEFRPGEMRHLTSDIRLARSAGYEPSTALAEGIARYVAWIRSVNDVRDYFAAAEAGLREKRIVHRLAAATR